MEFERGEHNVTESIFETKGGMRASLLEVSSNEDFEKILCQPVYKRAKKKIDLALKSGVGAAVQPFAAGKIVLKRFEETVVTLCGHEVRAKTALPRAGWADLVFEMKAFGCDETHVSCGWTDLGMCSAQLFLEGRCAIMGLRTDRVPGQTLREKRENVLRSDAQTLSTLLADGGWYVRIESGVSVDTGRCLLAVPTGFMLLQAGDKCRSLRWPFVADQADITRAKSCLQGLMDSFPAEYRQENSVSLNLAGHWGLKI